MHKWFVFVLVAIIASTAHAETSWRKDTFGYETYRNDKGEVWKRDRFGYDTWRSNHGDVCKRDRFGGAVRCQWGSTPLAQEIIPRVRRGRVKDSSKKARPIMKNPKHSEQENLVVEMARRQGGFVNIADVRKAAGGVKAGDPIVTRLEKAGKLLHVAQDSYKLVTTAEEAEMAKRDQRRPKPRRGRGSY
jgi:hypothetical protein